MGEPAWDHRLTVEQYLSLEREAELRHEYHDGDMLAMAGGTKNHGILGNAINGELYAICRSKSCTPFNGDVRIWIQAHNRFVYPEASVVCGPIETSAHDEDSIINPVLIAEVLSKTSEAYDRGEKFRYYRSLPSLQEYLLIDQRRPIVSIFRRRDDQIWEMQEVIGLDQTFHLQSLDATIEMAELYRNTIGLLEPWESDRDEEEDEA